MVRIEACCTENKCESMMSSQWVRLQFSTWLPLVSFITTGIPMVHVPMLINGSYLLVDFFLQANHTRYTCSTRSAGFSFISGILNMAASTVHAKFSDISSAVLPLQMTLKEKNFKFFVRGKDVKYLLDRKYQINLK